VLAEQFARRDVVDAGVVGVESLDAPGDEHRRCPLRARQHPQLLGIAADRRDRPCSTAIVRSAKYGLRTSVMMRPTIIDRPVRRRRRRPKYHPLQAPLLASGSIKIDYARSTC
jgi:hypothetical protein